MRREPVDPQRAVAFLVLGKASALAGALVAGGYLGFGLMFLGRLDAATPRERVIRSAVAVVAGLALMVAGLAARAGLQGAGLRRRRGRAGPRPPLTEWPRAVPGPGGAAPLS